MIALRIAISNVAAVQYGIPSYVVESEEIDVSNLQTVSVWCSTVSSGYSCFCAANGFNYVSSCVTVLISATT